MTVARVAKLPPEVRLGVEMNTSGVPAAKGRALYRRRPEFTGTLLFLWISYVRATMSASDGAFLLDGEKMRINWLLWSKPEARRCVKGFVQWLGPVRKQFRTAVRFLLEPKFALQRRKHWPRAGASRESIREYTERRGRDESVFVPGVTNADIEELYFACAKNMTAEWFNRCPDQAFVDCGHTVGFTAGTAVSIIRIQIGDLRAIQGMPDDGRDRSDRPFVRIDDLEFANSEWLASFKERCVKR